MPKLALTDLTVRSLKPPLQGQTDFWDQKTPGFAVRVSQGGAKTFIVKKDNRRITLGRYPALALSDARTAARRALAEVPTHSSKLSFPEARQLYLDTKAGRPSTVREATRILNRHFPFKKQLGAVTTHDLTAVFDRLLGTPSEANHAFKEARTFFRWTVRRRLISQSPMESLLMPHRETVRERVLTDEELKRVWFAAEHMAMFGRIVRLLILTGRRRGEVAALRAEWISKDTIAFPGTITKNSREHSIPLGAFTASIVSADVQSGLLFPARGGDGTPINGWSKSKRKLDKLSGVENWTLHDLRRTFATGLAALGTPIHVTEKLLNHISGTSGGLVAVYQKHQFWDEQVAALNAWEAKIRSLCPGAP